MWWTVAVGTARGTDLRELYSQVEPSVCTVFSFDKAGSAVVAVGNPEGLGIRQTQGNLSRSDQLNGFTILRHDAAISPGNSGGPLVLVDAGAYSVSTPSYSMLEVHKT